MTGLYTHYTNFNGAPRPFPFVSFVLPSATPTPCGVGAENPRPPSFGKEVNRALCHLPSRKDQDGGRIGRVREPYDPRRPDPQRRPASAQMNRVFIGSDDPAADAAALIPALDAVDDAGKRRRSNSVIAIEVLLTASPEWWADASAEQQQDWLDRSTAWLVQEYGRENIAHLRLHGDERTPHLTGYVVPLDPDTGHLNARRWIGGAARCRQQQTDYAAAVAPLGLSRGIEGSTATHERVRRHYAQISAPVATLEIEVPPRVLLNPDKWADEQVAAIGRQAAPSFARARTAE